MCERWVQSQGSVHQKPLIGPGSSSDKADLDLSRALNSEVLSPACPSHCALPLYSAWGQAWRRERSTTPVGLKLLSLSEREHLWKVMGESADGQPCRGVLLELLSQMSVKQIIIIHWLFILMHLLLHLLKELHVLNGYNRSTSIDQKQLKMCKLRMKNSSKMLQSGSSKEKTGDVKAYSACQK